MSCDPLVPETRVLAVASHVSILFIRDLLPLIFAIDRLTAYRRLFTGMFFST